MAGRNPAGRPRVIRERVPNPELFQGVQLVYQVLVRRIFPIRDVCISRYLGAERVAGLHRIGDVDHTPDVTVFYLISHTSGFSDYLEGKPIRKHRHVDEVNARAFPFRFMPWVLRAIAG